MFRVVVCIFPLQKNFTLSSQLPSSPLIIHYYYYYFNYIILGEFFYYVRTRQRHL